MITIHDIAKQLGINAGTVSRALRNQPGVSEELRKKVELMANQMGYQRNILASQLRSQTSSVIGLIVDDSWDWHSGAVADGVQYCAKANGCFVLVWNALSEEDQRTGLGIFEKMKLAGVIIASTHMNVIRDVPESTLPTFYINNIGGPETTSILWDDEHGSTMAILHLLALGHTKLGYINGPEDARHSIDRYRGLLKALDAGGLTFSEAWYGSGDWTNETGYREAKRILSLADRPTAIFCANDEIAVGVYDAARELGLKIPEDLSVIGYDNNTCCKYMRPELTTISLPLWDMGIQAVEDLLNRSKRPENIVGQRVIKGNLIIRNSTAPLNKG